MTRAPLSPARLAALRENIFPAAHVAIGDWDRFDWHRDFLGEPQAHKVQSSQALAIDVFGAIAAAPPRSRDAILDALARHAGLPAGGPWRVELEWRDPDNLLAEPRPTQVDVIAFGADAIMVIECKFTEAGGSCSQTNRLPKGPAKGLRQCDGRYAPQVHPVTGIAASCALAGKGIRYWDHIPRVFALHPDIIHDPCPFSGENFQWMRNMVLADVLGRDRGMVARCLIAYAAGGFATETKVLRADWLPELTEGAVPPFAVSFQQVVQVAVEVDDSPTWAALAAWVDRKVQRVGEIRKGGLAGVM